jgi:DNA-binding transcriptional regulator YiaG
MIDLKKTLEQAKGRITIFYLAKQLVRGSDTIRKWINGGKIPETAIDKLIEVLENNNVEIIYKNK